VEGGIERSAAEIAAAIGYVCRDPEQLRNVLPADKSILVNHVLTKALTEPLEAIRESLDKLHAALRQAGDTWGVYGQALRTKPSSAPGTSPLGASTPRPTETIYLCPIGRCDRFWFLDDRSPEDVPYCSVSGGPMVADLEPL
jgi:hypothetical protein